MEIKEYLTEWILDVIKNDLDREEILDIVKFDNTLSDKAETFKNHILNEIRDRFELRDDVVDSIMVEITFWLSNLINWEEILSKLEKIR